MRSVTITIEDSPEGESFIKSLQQFPFVRKVEESSDIPLKSSSLESWQERRDRLQTHLRQAPTLDEEELRIYEENRKYFDQWSER